jgi:hypothetical protein
MPTEWQHFDVRIDPGYSEPERRAIADDIIEHIRERTLKGLDKNGEPFPGYSDTYKHSIDFKIAGKGNKVDLTQTGDMLSSLQLLEDSPGHIVIGYEKGSKENAIADGNVRGTYGSQTPHPERARDFMGIESKALEDILAQHPIDDQIHRQQVAATQVIAEGESLSFQTDLQDLDPEEIAAILRTHGLGG